ncbi:unnamed protein product [Effrenium voratum]|uniref:Uncharacterized protein n=1 Tax=Effrenium voratum TaxID=2562239 RepID=A0AA36MTB2_9DINO|nr:unnamed protein product [Effrenium voratum]CAJ1439876.1 unnamed protein product [Effrenium voratum]CAJ1439877.1 unnamed protein product [Effrenium voratum]
MALPPGVLAAQARAQRAQKRQDFLQNFINEDLQKLASWHGMRPAHEQKRFLRSLDCLCKAYDAEPKEPRRPTEAEKQHMALQAQQKEQKQGEAMQRAAEEDPLAGPPRSPRMACSASEPCLVSQPIEVFEQKKRTKFKKQRDPTADDPNSLLEWLEGQSLTSQSTATTASTQISRFSDLALTSIASSICSHPGTLVQESYRPHRRAMAVNRSAWKPVNQHEAGAMRGGIPSIGWPDAERMRTSFEDQFGTPDASANLPKKMYEKVLHGNQHEFINRFLQTAPREQREQFSGMVRSLEYLRRQQTREHTSTSNLHFDLQENARLWRPPKQKPVFEPSEINISRVPLGSIGKKYPAQAPLPPMSLPPPSPSVSGLGSLPLTRVATPLASEAGSM